MQDEDTGFGDRKMSIDFKAFGQASALLTVSEAASMLNVHPNTIRHWSNIGLLTAYRLGQRKDRRFRLEDLNEFLSSSGTADLSD